MFLHPIIEWLDSLKSSDQFRKWAALSVKISGVFTLVTTFVLGIALLTLVLRFTRGSGIVAQTFAIIGTFFGLVIMGIVGITMATLFWNRSKKIASLGEESHLTFGTISGDLTRLLGEVAFIGFGGGAILFLVCSIFGAMMLGWIVLVLLALSFLFHFLAGGFLKFSYIIADISTNIAQVEPTLLRDVTAVTASEAVSSDAPSEEKPTPSNDERSPKSTEATAATPSEEKPTPSNDERSPEPTEATAATVPEAVSSDAPSEEKPTPSNDERSPEIIAEQDPKTDTNGYPYPESKGKLRIGWRLFVTLITCSIFGFFWKLKQTSILNGWLGRQEFSFWKSFGLTLLTCGIYGIYSEYQVACSINEIRDKYGMHVNSSFPTIYMVFFFFTLSIGTYAIMQNQINKLYDEYSSG